LITSFYCVRLQWPDYLTGQIDYQLLAMRAAATFSGWLIVMFGVVQGGDTGAQLVEQCSGLEKNEDRNYLAFSEWLRSSGVVMDRVAIRPSNVHGHGLFALEDLPTGSEVALGATWSTKLSKLGAPNFRNGISVDSGRS
jgi:hypothetical protein